MAQESEALPSLVKSFLRSGHELPYFLPSAMMLEECMGEKILY